MPLRSNAPVRKRLVAMTFGIAVGLLIAEGVLRLTGMVSPPVYQRDLILGSRLRPDYAGWNTNEGKVFFRTNHAGFRDRDHTVAKQSDTLRIVVLGDSYCEAVQVELERTFWSVLERELNQCELLTSKKIEVLNSGVSGYGTAQELLMLRHHLWKYEPDVVLLAFLSGNDIRNNSRELEPDSLKPFFTVQDDRLVLDDSFTEKPYFTSPWIRLKDELIRSSRLLYLLYQVRHRNDSANSADAESLEVGLEDFIYSEPTEQSQREAWRITERLIEEIHVEVEEHGAKLVIATLTNPVQVHPDVTVRQAACSKLDVADLGYSDRRVASLASRLGCPAIVLAKPMAEYAEQHNVYLHGFENSQLGAGHWNETGHRVAGEILAAELCRETRLWEP